MGRISQKSDWLRATNLFKQTHYFKILDVLDVSTQANKWYLILMFHSLYFFKTVFTNFALFEDIRFTKVIKAPHSHILMFALFQCGVMYYADTRIIYCECERIPVHFIHGKGPTPNRMQYFRTLCIRTLLLTLKSDMQQMFVFLLPWGRA